MNKNEQSINPYEETITIKHKDINFDLLRILLALFVIIQHISAQTVTNSNFNTDPLFVPIFLNNIARIAVPIFIMLSGYFNLNKENAPSIRKNIKKMMNFASIFIIWSLFYAFKNMVDAHQLHNEALNIRNFISILNFGQYHLWFLPTLIYCYAMSPMFFSLKEYENGKYLKYFALLFLIFGVFKQSVNIILNLSEHITLQSLFHKFTMFSTASYLYYYFFGYYISKYNIKIKNRWLIALLIFITMLNTSLTMYFSASKNHFVGVFGEPFFITLFLQSLLLYKIFQNLKHYPFLEKYKNAITNTSELTFGIYLIHPVFVKMLEQSSLINFRFHPLFIPISSILIFGICAIISFLLKKIPLLKKII